MTIISQISNIVRTSSVDGSTVTLRLSDFQDIPVMVAFFNNVVGADQLVITDAQVLPVEDSELWLAITGTGSFLGAENLATLLTFCGPDVDVVIRLQGDYPDGNSYVLPVIDWLALYSRRVVARLTGQFDIVTVHYEGQAGANPPSAGDPRFRLRLRKFARA